MFFPFSFNFFFPVKIYKEHKLYVQSWKKRKRMVGHFYFIHYANIQNY